MPSSAAYNNTRCACTWDKCTQWRKELFGSDPILGKYVRLPYRTIKNSRDKLKTCADEDKKTRDRLQTSIEKMERYRDCVLTNLGSDKKFYHEKDIYIARHHFPHAYLRKQAVVVTNGKSRERNVSVLCAALSPEEAELHNISRNSRNIIPSTIFNPNEDKKYFLAPVVTMKEMEAVMDEYYAKKRQEESTNNNNNNNNNNDAPSNSVRNKNSNAVNTNSSTTTQTVTEKEKSTSTPAAQVMRTNQNHNSVSKAPTPTTQIIRTNQNHSSTSKAPTPNTQIIQRNNLSLPTAQTTNTNPYINNTSEVPIPSTQLIRINYQYPNNTARVSTTGAQNIQTNNQSLNNTTKAAASAAQTIRSNQSLNSSLKAPTPASNVIRTNYQSLNNTAKVPTPASQVIRTNNQSANNTSKVPTAGAQIMRTNNTTKAPTMAAQIIQKNNQYLNSSSKAPTPASQVIRTNNQSLNNTTKATTTTVQIIRTNQNINSISSKAPTPTTQVIRTNQNSNSIARASTTTATNNLIPPTAAEIIKTNQSLYNKFISQTIIPSQSNTRTNSNQSSNVSEIASASIIPKKEATQAFHKSTTPLPKLVPITSTDNYLNNASFYIDKIVMMIRAKTLDFRNDCLSGKITEEKKINLATYLNNSFEKDTHYKNICYILNNMLQYDFTSTKLPEFFEDDNTLQQRQQLMNSKLYRKRSTTLHLVKCSLCPTGTAMEKLNCAQFYVSQYHCYNPTPFCQACKSVDRNAKKRLKRAQINRIAGKDPPKRRKMRK